MNETRKNVSFARWNRFWYTHWYRYKKIHMNFSVSFKRWKFKLQPNFKTNLMDSQGWWRFFLPAISIWEFNAYCLGRPMRVNINNNKSNSWNLLTWFSSIAWLEKLLEKLLIKLRIVNKFKITFHNVPLISYSKKKKWG